MAIPTSRSDSGIDIQLKALNNPTESGGIMVEGYPITVVEDVIGLQPAVQTWIAQYGSIKFQIWDSATSGTFPPTSGAYNTIYLVPAEGAPNNVYDEYIYVQEEQATDHWEIIGNTQADVSNKMNKAGTYTTSHVLIGLSGGTAIDGGKFLGSNTFNGTSSNYLAREDGVVNYVSAALNGTSDHVVAFSGGGKLKDTGKIVGGSAFVALSSSPELYLATEAGVRAFMSTADAVESLPSATTTQRGTVYFVDDLDEGQMTYPSETAPSVAAVNSALALTQPRLTFNAPLVSGANNTVSINMATTASSGAVVLTSTPSASGGVAATPALVSTALNGTSDHVVAYSAGGKLKDTGKIVGGATFATTPVSTTLATELGVSKFVSAYVSASAITDIPSAGYTAASSGLMYVVSSGGALTITSGGLSINAASVNAPGVVQLTNTVGTDSTHAATPAMVSAVSSALASAIGTKQQALTGYGAVVVNGGSVYAKGATATSSGVTFLYSTVNTSTNGAVTPAAVSAYVSTQISSAVPLATSSGAGIVQIGSNIEITSGGIISVPMAGDSLADPNVAPGVVFVDNDGYMTTSAVPTGIAVSTFVTNAISAATPIATSNTAGLVKVGSNLFITGDMDDIPGQLYVKDGSTASKGVVKLQSTINTANGVALTPGAVNTFITGISGVAPINENLTATGGTISISSATTTQSGAVLIMAGGTFTSAANKVATEGAVFSNCIFYSIV